jgi:hypothetical protein
MIAETSAERVEDRRAISLGWGQDADPWGLCARRLGVYRNSERQVDRQRSEQNETPIH